MANNLNPTPDTETTSQNTAESKPPAAMSGRLLKHHRSRPGDERPKRGERSKRIVETMARHRRRS
jgi:hypothetical protein